MRTYLEFLLLKFPCGIAHPIVHIHPIAPDIILKLLSLPALEFMKLLQVGETLGRGLQACLLTVYSFSEKLLGRYLNGRSALVLDSRGATRGLHLGW